MRERWNLFGLCAAALLLLCHFCRCSSLNLEGLSLLEFRWGVEIDPHGAFETWDANDDNPCNWSGVHCVDGKVEILYLMEFSLGGVLAPELGSLSHLRALVLNGNKFTGVIPKEIGGLNMLELLDLRGNNLTGTIPRELGEMLSLKCLLLSDNKFEGGTPSWMEKLDLISDLKSNSDLPCEMGSEIGCTNGKVGHCIWQRSLQQQLKKGDSLVIPLKGQILRYFDMQPLFKLISHSSPDDTEKHGDNLLTNFSEPYITQSAHAVNTVRRHLLQETSNLAAVPVSRNPPQEVAVIPSVGSGSFPAIPSSSDENGGKKEASPPPDSSPFVQTPGNTNNSVADEKLGTRAYVLIAVVAVFLLILAAIMLLVCGRRRGGAIGPWRTGLSGQLQKAFVTGVPKLNRAELEAACEDFSNIIISFPHCTLFKGTLSSGVEICVVSTAVKSVMDWAERSELYFRKKIDTLSRVNHKNFVNLLGYCEENEPFMRMMVFEYSPNGTLFDYLHVKEYEHLDWSARMRIIMGVAYCLQHMHHDLNPPVALADLQSCSVFITDDFAAKVVDNCLFRESASSISVPGGDDDKDTSKLWEVGPESNVYSFGMLMLEIISGKLQYSEEGSIADWGAKYLDDKGTFSSMVDPTLKSSNDTELEILCGVLRKCLCQDPCNRPTMKEVTSSLKEVLGISPEAATPRLSPLWWAELEILSVEAS